MVSGPPRCRSRYSSCSRSAPASCTPDAPCPALSLSELVSQRLRRSVSGWQPCGQGGHADRARWRLDRRAQRLRCAGCVAWAPAPYPRARRRSASLTDLDSFPARLAIRLKMGRGLAAAGRHAVAWLQAAHPYPIAMVLSLTALVGLASADGEPPDDRLMLAVLSMLLSQLAIGWTND